MDAAPVLVIGEALVDIVASDGGSVEHPGGGPANIALGLGRRGLAPELLTWIARDRHGVLVAEHLEASGVRIVPASFGAARTSTATATLRADGSAAYDFDVEWDVALDALERPFTAIHTGSIAAFAAPGAAKVADLITHAGASIVSFDPNIRPALVPPHPEAVRACERMLALATLVKLSDEDAAWLWPDSAPDDVLDRLLAQGPRLAAMTLGGDGAVLATATDRVRVDAPRVEVVDTIGAGDTFMASLLASVIAHGDAPVTAGMLERFGREAARAAAITVSRAGADLPWTAELV